MSDTYYQDDHITLYHEDCREILPTLGVFDLLLTDPPYGIKRDKGNATSKGAGFYAENIRKQYHDCWDHERPEADTLRLCLGAANKHIIWGGNYFSDILDQRSKWLVWDKMQTMPKFSDAELAWTSLEGVAVKMLRYSGNGLLATEKDRVHPTQKPLELMKWCIGFAKEAKTIIDPFAGSGTTGRAAKDLGRKCILIEREERYCEIAAKRMAQEVLF
jgi:DNA modification methylase